MSDFDLATLKIEVDTSQLAAATTALNNFSTASKKASATQIANQKEEDVYARAGIKSLAERREKVTALSAAMKQLHIDHAAGNVVGWEYKRMHDEITKAQNLAMYGNSRHRGAIRQTAAAMASLTFEMTGAIYGVVALTGALAAPAFFGIAMLKRIEDARTGITGILLSMGSLEGKALTFGQAWEVSGQYVKKVQQDSMRYGIDMGRLMEVNQAAMSGGLNAMLNLEQIQKVATAGAVAVSSLGLNSQQYVQEVRDLISGGIQPASSTLARSIGVTDALLKEWKAQGPAKLVEELTKRLQGFMVVADEVRSKTLTGAWDILQARLSMLLSDEEGFGAIKKAVLDVANYIGTVDISGKFVINESLLASAQTYWETLKSIGELLVSIGSVVKDLSPAITVIAQTLTVLIKEISFVFRMIAGEITTIATQAVAVAHLDFSGAANIGKIWAAEAAAARKELDASVESMLTPKTITTEIPKINLRDVTGKKFENIQDKDQSIKDYERQTMSALKRNAVTRMEIELGRSLFESERDLVELGVEKNKVKFTSIAQGEKELELILNAGTVLDKERALVKDEIGDRNKLYSQMDRGTKSIIDETEAIKRKTAIIGMSKAEIAAYDAAQAKAKGDVLIATIKQNNAIQDLTDTEIGYLQVAYQVANEVDKKAFPPELVERIKARTDALKNNSVALDENAEKQARLDAVKTAAKEEEEIMKQMSSNIADIMYQSMTGAFVDIGKMFKNMVLRMVADLAAQRFVVGVSGALFGTAAQAMEGGAIQDATSGLIGSGGMNATGSAMMAGFNANGIAGAFAAAPVMTTMAGAAAAYVIAKYGFGWGNEREYSPTRLEAKFGRGGKISGRMASDWKVDGGWFSSDETGTDYSEITKEQMQLLKKTSDDLQVTFNELGRAIGDTSISTRDWTVDINQAGDITDALASGIAGQVVPALEKFRMEGEKLADTAKRLTAVFSSTSNFIDALGLTPKQAFGYYGLEGTEQRQKMIQGAGGEQAFAQGSSAFISSILTPAQQLDMSLKEVGRTFAQLNIVGVETNQQFYDLVKKETELGNYDRVGALLRVADAFSKVTKSAEDTTNALVALLKTQSFRTLVDYQRAVAYAKHGAPKKSGGKSLIEEATEAAKPIQSEAEKEAESLRRKTLKAKALDALKAKEKEMDDALIKRERAWSMASEHERINTNHEMRARETARLEADYKKEIARLQAEYEALPAYAAGGIHSGGWRIVGERGPEIEYTPPSRIFSNSESRGMLAANDDTAIEIKNLRAELQAIGVALARNTGETAKILRKFDGDGLPAERVLAA